MTKKPLIGFIGQGWIGKNYANDFENRGYQVVRYSLEAQYAHNKKKIAECDFVFIAVPTPTTPKGFDSSVVEEALTLVGKGNVAIIKSTVFPGTTESLQKKNPGKYVLHSPEFLSSATAAEDVTEPKRNIIGIPIVSEEYNKKARSVLSLLPKALFESIVPSSASELIKYSSNCFYYTKVVFVNMLYDVAIKLGLSWKDIKDAMAADPWIGTGGMHLDPVHKGARGAGGHCFIKDFKAFADFYAENVRDEKGDEILKSIQNKNISLLKESKKDLENLKAVYGKNS